MAGDFSQTRMGKENEDWTDVLLDVLSSLLGHSLLFSGCSRGENVSRNPIGAPVDLEI